MSGLSHTLSHTPMHCIAVQHCADIQAKQASQARPHRAQHCATRTKPQQGPKSGQQGPKKRRARPAYRPALKTRCRPVKSFVARLQHTAITRCAIATYVPCQPLTAGKACGTRARAPTRVNARATCAGARAYGGVGVRRIGLGASHTRYKFSFHFTLGLGSAIRLAFHSRRASLSALQALSPCRSVM